MNWVIKTVVIGAIGSGWGCATPVPTFYHVPVTQGHLLDSSRIDQIQVGMSQATVRELLGEPLLRDPFQSSRWDYWFNRRSGPRDLERRRLSLFFENGTLQRIEGDFSDERTAGS